MSASLPRIQGFKVRAVRVPMTEPHRTASGVITESPLVLTDVLTDAGVTGHSMVFTYTPAALKPTADLIRNFEALVKGDALAPADVEQKLAKRFRLLGHPGAGRHRSGGDRHGALGRIGEAARSVARAIAGLRGKAHPCLWRGWL